MAVPGKKFGLSIFAFILLLGTALAGTSLTVNLNSSQNYAPISGALVKVWDSASSNLLDANYTNSAGSITFFNLPSGNVVRVTAEKSGYINASSLIGLYSSETKTIILAADSNITTYLTRMPDQNAGSAALAVNVYGLQSLPLAGALVSVYDSNTSALLDSNYTNAYGATIFLGLPLGKIVNVTVTKSGYKNGTGTQMLSLAWNSLTVYMISDQNAPDQNVSLKVYVRDSNSAEGIANVTVTATKTDGSFSQSASTHVSNGVYYPANFSSMPKGNYLLSASKAGYYTNTKTMNLTANSETTINLTKVPDTHYLIVTVYDEGGIAVQEAKVGVFRADINASKAVSTTTTDSLGRAAFSELADSDYLVVASKTGYTSSKVRAQSDTNISITITKITKAIVDASNSGISGVRGMDFGNSTPELVKIDGKEVYQITGETEGKLLGVIPVKVGAVVRVNPETNEVIGVDWPWWRFLVSIP